MLELHWLKTFVTLARLEHFGKAAYISNSWSKPPE